MNFYKIVEGLALNLLLLLSVYSEYEHLSFRADILQLIGVKRDVECRAILTTLRPGICLIVEKDCCFKIFNRCIEENMSSTKRPVFIYSNKDQTIHFKDGYADPETAYFILSPYIEADPEYNCHYYAYSLAPYMEHSLASFFYTIFNRIERAGYTSFDLEEVHYSRTRLGGLELYEFAVKELGHIRFTRYRQDNPVMGRVHAIADELSKIAKHQITKSAWCTYAVDLLMSMLLEYGILRVRVSLDEYPEVVPLLFPFKFINTETPHWTYVELISVGVDLRGVERSGMAHLFDGEQVQRRCREGGVYISSRRY